ncbi:MFS transporter [Agrococcus sp. ARC_14]|uniref:MFS transporter n=1 Tax=Agrococcus sp. ARC_14 TaxID=2919927 RepID=UPI001F06E611|nr:MFS transporter [Agrococcus sp. ARC_14]
MTRARRRYAFVVATVALLLVFVSSGSPIPQLNGYRDTGMADSTIAAAAVVYLLAAAVALLVLGRLADHLGRKPVAITALLLSAAGVLVLMTVGEEWQLLTGRLLQGIACGIATGSLGAIIVDAAPAQPRWLAPLVTGNVPALGGPVGALAASVLVDFGPAPQVLPYAIIAALLASAAVLVGLAHETGERRPGALSSLVPKLVVPQDAGLIVLAAGAAIGSTWSMGSFFQAFGPSVAVEQFGTNSAVVVGLVFAAGILPAALGGPIAGRGRVAPTLVIGLAIFTAAIAGIVASVGLGSVPGYFVAALISGVAAGAIATAANRLVLPTAAPHQRAGLLSTMYLISYASAAIPGLAASAVADIFTVTQVAVGHGIVVVGAAALSLIALAFLMRRGLHGLSR